MPRLTADQWESVRAEREAGATFMEVAGRYGINHAAIVRRAKAEGWSDGKDISDVIRRKVTEKVTGIVTACEPKKKAEAIEAEVSRAVAVVRKHREDWDEHQRLYPLSEIKETFDIGKSAKITSEMLAIRQKAERIAWGLEEKTQDNKTIVISHSHATSS